MTGYVVHCSQAHQLPRQIGGAFQTLARCRTLTRLSTFIEPAHDPGQL
jgi:hypothetical protein